MKIMLHSAIERKGVNMIRRGSQIRSERSLSSFWSRLIETAFSLRHLYAEICMLTFQLQLDVTRKPL